MRNESEGTPRFFTPGTLVLLAVMVVGYTFGLARFVSGIGSVTNLSATAPWGIWIAVDVATGVALAAGGFTTAALIHIFGRRRYHALERSALLSAWLGYLFVGIALLFDLGRYYNIWHPAIYWQGNSVLFEVGMCVMFYLTVLTIEISPALIDGLLQHAERGSVGAALLERLAPLLRAARAVIRRAMPIFLIAGVVLSCMHQSSLGSLMLIAPTKLSALWWTPILPVLFLLSAIMVGLPMVIFESILSARGLGHRLDMDLLAGLARIVRWVIVLYATVKVVDLAVRLGPADLWRDPKDTTALLVELGAGLLLPLVLLSLHSVRSSPRGLFIAVSLVIGGVVLNRLNVFLVGYDPPFADVAYFPSVGEVAVTLGLVATIVFLYRFFAYYFPVAPDHEPTRLGWGEAASAGSGFGVWAGRGLAAALLLGFVLAYAQVHRHGVQASERLLWQLTYRSTGGDAGPVDDPIAVPEATSFSAETMPPLVAIAHPAIASQIDDYEAVRFLHRAHATREGGDCSVCHHRVQEHADDRIGVEVSFTMLDGRKPAACSACHRAPGEPDAPLRPGLKAAYHQMCMGCHETHRGSDAAGFALGGAPTGCRECHRPHVPDHTHHIRMAGSPSPMAVTERCLECHPEVGEDILASAHWNWAGPSPNTRGHEHAVHLGKRGVANNYCIHVRSNEARCAQCHIGYGFVDESFDFDDPTRIDCLVCHDTTGAYRKDAPSGGMPAPEVDLVHVAQRIGRPSRHTCGVCHFYGGGGANVKHGDLEPALADPPASFDVHMGEHDMRCQDCHRTDGHRIAGQCLAIPTSEGRIRCEQCHGETPHALTGPHGAHLDRHVASISCEMCHIPSFAKETPTKLSWDWSKAGQDLPQDKDELGMPTFAKKKGAFEWGLDVNPCYAWYDGHHRRLVPGDELDPNGVTLLNKPCGSKEDPRARLAPFKCYKGVIPIDAVRRTLAIPKLWQGFWAHFDWERALRDGMEALGQPFSGELGWARADMYWGIHHEVVPAGQALRCADCHAQENVSCRRCHGDDAGVNEEALLGPVYPEGPRKWADFEGFGYDGDPAVTGGRLRTQRLPGNAAAPRAPATEPR